MTRVPAGCGCSACHAASLRQDTIEPQALQPPGTNGPGSLIEGSVWPNSGTGITLYYNFWNSLPSYYSALNEEAAGFQAFTSQMKTATVKVLNMIETFTKINFVQTTSENITHIGFAQTDLPAPAAAWAYYPHLFDRRGGDVWTDKNEVSSTNLQDGSFSFYVIMHEIGHALGLQHTFSGGLTGAQDTEQYSVMAYDTSPWGSTFAQSFQLYDIWALQQLYGANTSYNSGNTVYRLEYGRAYTIWDGGGIDTLDGSTIRSAMIINLDAGTFSSVGESRNIAIAYGVTIENATGGSGNDVFYGNDADNIILGGGGTDTFFGSLGNDVLDAQGGNGRVHYTYSLNSFSFDRIDHNIIELKHLTLGFIDKTIDILTYFFNGLRYSFSEIADLANQENRAPIAAADEIIAAENQVTTGNVLADNGNGADSDPDGNPLIVIAETKATAQGGTVNILANGDFTYTPRSDYIGADSFTYVVSDGELTDQGHVGITVTDMNQVTGAAARDTLYGTVGDDWLQGLGDRDKLYGYDGSDYLQGGSGSDWLHDGWGRGYVDRLDGGTGDDNYAVVSRNTHRPDVIITDASGMDVVLFMDSEAVPGPTVAFLERHLSVEWTGGDDVRIVAENALGNRVEMLLEDQLLALNDDFGAGIEYFRLSTSASNTSLGGTYLFDVKSWLQNDAVFVSNGTDGNDTLTGITKASLKDALYGGEGNDLLYGQDGLDVLFGEAGADTFVFESASAFNDIDIIEDFSLAEDDKIDISDLITGYDPLQDAITDFIEITSSGFDTVLKVDANGGADNFVQVTTLKGVTGLEDEDALEADGNLIVV